MLLTMVNHSLWSSSEKFTELINEERIQTTVIPPVSMTCVQVLPNGDVSLTWEPSVAGTGTFIEYQVFSLQNGPVPIATILDINTATFTHVGANGDLGQKDYYVATLSDCGGMTDFSYSDTVSSIFLEINDLGDGRVLLEWNPTHQPQLPGEEVNYQILREYPAGNWQVRKLMAFGTFSYRDTIDICSAFINYQIEVNHSSGCKSMSNIEGDLLSDVINPYIPTLTRVSIDTISQHAIINWDKNQSSDTYGYIILKFINGFWENLDTIYGIANTSYIDITAKEDIQPETYAVAAFDSCLVNNVPPNYQTSAASESHSTIFAESTVNICDLEMSFKWTSYEGWSGDVSLDHYDVLMKKGGEPFQILAELEPNKVGYSFNGLEINETYCFFIRAVSSDGVFSYSNKITKTILPPANTKFHYLVHASHVTDEIEVKLYTDSDANAQAYELYKKGPRDFEFNIIQSVIPEGTDTIFFRDDDVNGRGAYEYKVGIIDSCNQTSEITPITKTIFLDIETDNSSFKNTLNWTSYEGFDALIDSYEVYRSDYAVGNFKPIATGLPPNTNSYEDTDLYEGGFEGGYCYKILVKEKPNQYGFRGEAFSNEECTALEPVIWIPSAFYTGSIETENTEFKPVISLYDFDTYLMEIFNREGGRIFITDNIGSGWKGLMPNGGNAQEGVFVYRITFNDVEGRRYEKVGTFVLLQK